MMDWHQRFNQQAAWTADLRRYIYQRVRLSPGWRVLEAGCGTGAVMNTLTLPLSQGEREHISLLSQRERVGVGENLHLHGLDLNHDHLLHARHNAPESQLTCGDALSLPYADESFDFVFCHFLLLWLADSGAALSEMRRVTSPGGWMAAMAEPDYGGRVDYPEALSGLGSLQAESLRRQGANPNMGRRLKGLFSHLELINVECGVMGAQWKGRDSTADLGGEWRVIREDMKNIMSSQELEDYYAIERDAREKGERVLYVPTFYALGQKSRHNKTR